MHYAEKISKHTVSNIQYNYVNMDIHINNVQNCRPIILVKQIAVRIYTRWFTISV